MDDGKGGKQNKLWTNSDFFPYSKLCCFVDGSCNLCGIWKGGDSCNNKHANSKTLFSCSQHGLNAKQKRLINVHHLLSIIYNRRALNCLKKDAASCLWSRSGGSNNSQIETMAAAVAASSGGWTLSSTILLPCCSRMPWPLLSVPVNNAHQFSLHVAPSALYL